jgi:hypothetical protein
MGGKNGRNVIRGMDLCMEKAVSKARQPFFDVSTPNPLKKVLVTPAEIPLTEFRGHVPTGTAVTAKSTPSWRGTKPSSK